MHHGTLMFHSDLSVVADVLNVSADKFQSKAAKSVKARVTNIAPYLPEGFTLAQFKALLLKYILKEENVQPYVFSAEELAEIEKIKKERYDKWEWNYGFSPSYSVEKSRRFEGCGKIEVHMNTEDGSITDLQFFGDFFGVKDSADLAKALIGTKLEQQALESRLADFDIAQYFHGLEKNDFLNLLLQSE